MKVSVNAHAKINLTLDIVGRREDGYHLVTMIMQSVSLSDLVTVSLTKEHGVLLRSDAAWLPCDEKNTAVRAVQVFLAAQGKNEGVSIAIHKRIPTEAGLAGGSADAAAVLVALNRLYGGELTLQELCDLGVAVGADVPFCLTGGTMLAEGIGERLSPLPELPDCAIVLVKPQVGVSTQEAYHLADSVVPDVHPQTRKAVGALEQRDLTGVAACLQNTFEDVYRLVNHDVAEQVEKIRTQMRAFGALGACMSGSGSTVFGIFSSAQAAETCKASFCSQYREVYLCRPMRCGCQVLL